RLAGALRRVDAGARYRAPAPCPWHASRRHRRPGTRRVRRPRLGGDRGCDDREGPQAPGGDPGGDHRGAAYGGPGREIPIHPPCGVPGGVRGPDDRGGSRDLRRLRFLGDKNAVTSVQTPIGSTNSLPALRAEEQAALRRVAALVARGAPSDELFAAVAAEVGGLLGADL